MDEPLGDVTKKELVDLYNIMKEEGHVPKESAGHLEVPPFGCLWAKSQWPPGS